MRNTHSEITEVSVCYGMLKVFIMTCMCDLIACLSTFEKDHRYQGKLCTPYFQDYGAISSPIHCGVKCESSLGCHGYFHSVAQKTCYGMNELPESPTNCSSSGTFHLYRKLACGDPPAYDNATVLGGNSIARQFTCTTAYVRTVQEIYCDVDPVSGTGIWQPVTGICTEMYGSSCAVDAECADIQGACILGICTCSTYMEYDIADMLCKPRFKLVAVTGGDGYISGQLYMLHGGQWGNVCWEHWTWTATMAVCQDIDPAFIYGGAWHEKEVYGRGLDNSPSYKLKNLDCGTTGDVASITNCTMDPVETNCDHNKDMGLTCYDTDISGAVRLDPAYTKDGPGSENRLEVLYNGTWGTVCKNDWNAGDVTCLSIDPSLPRKDGECKDSCPGGPSGPYKVDFVKCDGDEPHVFYCKNGGWDKAPTCPGEEVGLVCKAA